MNVFGNIKNSLVKYRHSYGDQIIRTVITSKFAKSKVNNIVIMMSTIMLRNLLCIIFCIAFHTGNYYLDFIFETLISILCLFSSTFIYDGLHGKKELFYKYTKYYINNYTPSNYRRWKRNLVLPIALLFIFSTYFYEITNEYIRYLVWQSLLIYFIMDVIEHNKIKIVSDYLYKTNMNPKTIVKKEMVIEPGFMMMDKEEYKIKKAKEMYEKRLAYIEEEERLRKQAEEEKQRIREQRENENGNVGLSFLERMALRHIDEDVDMSCSSEVEIEDEADKEDKEMGNLEATYESISYVLE